MLSVVAGGALACSATVDCPNVLPQGSKKRQTE